MSYKKNPTTKWHIDPWPKITEFLIFREVFIDFIYQNLDLDIAYFLNQAQICIRTTRTSQVRKKKKGKKILLENSVRCFNCFRVSASREQAHTPYCRLIFPFLAKPQKCPAGWKSKQTSKRQGCPGQSGSWHWVWRRFILGPTQFIISSILSKPPHKVLRQSLLTLTDLFLTIISSTDAFGQNNNQQKKSTKLLHLKGRGGFSKQREADTSEVSTTQLSGGGCTR